VHKGSTQTNKRLKKGFKNKGAKKPSVPWSGAPHCPVCHQTVSGAIGLYSLKLVTLRFLRARSAIIHRTVRCTSEGTAPSRNGRLQKLENHMNSEEQCTQSQSHPSEAHRTLNSACPVPLEDKVSNGQKLLNPNGWVMWLTHRTVSGAPIDSSHPQRLCGG
jgi:hypothetical protein